MRIEILVDSKATYLLARIHPLLNSGIALSERTQKLIAKLFSRSDGCRDFRLLYRAVSSIILVLTTRFRKTLERITWFAILKLTEQSPLNLAVGIYFALTDLSRSADVRWLRPRCKRTHFVVR